MKKNKGIGIQNSAVRLNSGRVGNVRYVTKGDKTYTRTVASDCSNPQTRKQMYGRIRLVNTFRHWRVLKQTVVRQLWEDVTPMVSAYNLFVKRAMQCVPIFLKKTSIPITISAPYGISQGSLPALQYGVNEDGLLVSSVYLGEDFVIDENTTVGEFTEALMIHNDTFIMGDELLFVGTVQEDKGDDELYIHFTEGCVELLAHSKKKLLNVVNNALGFGVTDGFLSTREVPESGCYAWVHMRRVRRGTDDEEVKVSTQDLFNCNEEIVSRFSSEESLDTVIDSYGKK